VTEKRCPQCGEIKPRTVACPWCRGPVPITEEPKHFVERAIEQIWFAGGLVAMIVACLIGFGVCSVVVCLPFALAWWLLKDVSASWFWIGLVALVAILWLIGLCQKSREKVG